MGGVGGLNPLPLSVGGGESLTEQIYREMRKMVGVGGPGPEWMSAPASHDAIEDYWRFCKACVVAASLSSVERAALQALPAWATDHLPVYEEALGLPRAASDAARQALAAAAWVLQLSAAVPSMRADLRAIDANVDIDSTTLAYAHQAISHFGKLLGDRSAALPGMGSGPSASRHASVFPNYADAFVLQVVYVLPAGVLAIPATVEAEVARYLCEVLPSHVTFNLSTSAPGFFLDGGADGASLLDQATFG